MGVSKNIPANRRSMAGFAPVPLLAAGLAISLCEKSIGEGFSSASGVVTTPGSLSTAERKSKETRVEPVDLENITMIGQLTIEERASTAAFPNDRLDGREGGVISLVHHTPASKTDRCRSIPGMAQATGIIADTRSQNRWWAQHPVPEHLPDFCDGGTLER